MSHTIKYQQYKGLKSHDLHIVGQKLCSLQMILFDN